MKFGKFTAGLVLVFAWIGLTAFSLKPKTFAIDANASSVSWQWDAENAQHSGVMYVSSGELLVTKQGVSGGTVQVDITSLTVSTVRDLRQNAAVTSWMKGRDFFDTYHYPTAEFKITSIRLISGNDYTLTGFLKTKGKTIPVRIPASLNAQKGKINLMAQIIVTLEQLTGERAEGSVSLPIDTTDRNFKMRLHLVAQKQ